MSGVVALLGGPPLAFLLVLAAGSVLAVRAGATSSEAASAWVSQRIAAHLAATLALVGLALLGAAVFVPSLRTALADGLATGSPRGFAAGVAAGAVLAAVYFGGLDRLVVLAQERIGDYVPAGSTAALGAGGVAFFVANVVLAPLVEELWYRGLVFDALASSLPPLGALVVGCAAFGLCHWPGGAWYVLVTGVLVGGACWALRAWDGGLPAPYAAHLTLNAVEFVVLTRRARTA